MTALHNPTTAGFDLLPGNTAEASLIDRIAHHEIMGRLFFLSDKPRPGLDYDDRLQERLGLSKNTIRKYVASGALSAAEVDGKIIVSEEGIRQFANPMRCLNNLPHLTGKINIRQLSEVQQKHLPPYALRLASEEDLRRRAHEIVEEEPEYADETRHLINEELDRRAKNKKA